MPLYEYECASCHKRTEKIQKFSDPELTICPHCGGPLARTITAPSFQFAGGGWYKDGYGSVKPAAGGEGKSEGESKSGSAPAAASSGESSGTPASTAPAAPAAAAAAPAAPSATPAAKH